MPVGKSCASILEQYFTLELSATVSESLTNVYPDKEGTNKSIPIDNKMSVDVRL
jgi:hypothetical protein